MAEKQDAAKVRYWQNLIREAARSGLSIREFCLKKGVSDVPAPFHNFRFARDMSGIDSVLPPCGYAYGSSGNSGWQCQVMVRFRVLARHRQIPGSKSVSVRRS